MLVCGGMSSPDPLAGIDDIDWSRLFHAYGRATDVPGQLRALCSDDADVRGRAHYQLRGNVYHQGTRWQGSYAVVPFLVALADDPSTPARELVIDLIRLVAVGDRNNRDLPFDPDAAFACADSVTAERAYEFAEALCGGERDSEDIWEEFPDVINIADVAWSRDAYRAAQAEADRFGTWAASADLAVAEAATELLAWFSAA